MVLTVLGPGLLGGSHKPPSGDKDDHFFKADSAKIIDTTGAPASSSKVADAAQLAKTESLVKTNSLVSDPGASKVSEVK